MLLATGVFVVCWLLILVAGVLLKHYVGGYWR